MSPDSSRVASLRERFSAVFPDSRERFLIRAPGRTNLIGEHTDYHGLPVLPMAIERDILLYGAPRRDAVVVMHNLDPAFSARSFEISGRIVPWPPGDWGNYAKAAAQSLGRHLSGRAGGLRGFDAVVHGNIPMAAGLASSSSLVVACALAILSANELDLERTALAELLAWGERYVGTRGGGMDQAVCLMAEQGHALKIEFFPIRTERIPIPSGYNFVVCHSGVPAPKSAGARLAYNLRAAESHMAAAVMGKMLFPPVGTGLIKRLGEVFSKLSGAEIESAVESAFRKEAFTLAEIASLLGMDEVKLRRSYLEAFDDRELASVREFRLRSRCRHVLTEGNRVYLAAHAIRAGEMETFGRLMYESHESCARDYEVSLPELDMLVDIAREAGALGSRLTGAGFGGCTVSLVREAEVNSFIELVKQRYYRDYLAKKTGVETARRAIFACRPAAGARLSVV